MRMKIEVSTELYEYTHGVKPRGRGNWAFEWCYNGRDWTAPVFIEGQMTYGEAKKEAIRRAQRAGCSKIRVAT